MSDAVLRFARDRVSGLSGGAQDGAEVESEEERSPSQTDGTADRPNINGSPAFESESEPEGEEEEEEEESPAQFGSATRSSSQSVAGSPTLRSERVEEEEEESEEEERDGDNESQPKGEREPDELDSEGSRHSSRTTVDLRSAIALYRRGVSAPRSVTPPPGTISGGGQATSDTCSKFYVPVLHAAALVCMKGASMEQGELDSDNEPYRTGALDRRFRFVVGALEREIPTSSLRSFWFSHAESWLAQIATDLVRRDCITVRVTSSTVTATFRAWRNASAWSRHDAGLDPDDRNWYIGATDQELLLFGMRHGDSATGVGGSDDRPLGYAWAAFGLNAFVAAVHNSAAGEVGDRSRSGVRGRSGERR